MGTLRLSPAAVEISPGESTTVEVWLQNASNYYGLDLALTYDPAIVEVPSGHVNPLWEVFAADSHFVVIDRAAAGQVRYALANLNPAKPFSGTGRVCSITFRARAPGRTVLSLATVKGSTRNGQALWPAKADGAIVVHAPASTRPSQTTQVRVTADAWVEAGAPNTNHGSDRLLRLRTQSQSMAVLQAPLPATARGQHIERARLWLYVTGQSSDQAGTLKAFALQRPWREGSVTWVSPWAAPQGKDPSDARQEPAGSATVSAINRWVAIDVTSAVQAWADGSANHGLLLKYNTPSGGECWLASREYAGRGPYLEVTSSAPVR